MSVKYDQITNPESFLVFSTAIKCICWHSWAFLPTEMTVFTTLSYTSKQVKSLPFHTPEALKRYPFRVEPLRIGNYRDYPPRGMTFVAGNTVPICQNISFGTCFHTTLLTNYSIS